tara:strand:- start:86538 stop:87458 length:921 start_codon:yes stop_codon:yes gene_type:complete
MKLNLHLLRIFYAVTENHNFSRAAEALFISQPAVSKGVRELEHQLGLPLIDRVRRAAQSEKGVRLTDNGQALREHARGIFALERAAMDDIEARINLKRGRLVVGASTTVGGYNLPPYIADFLQQHPLVDIQIVVGNTRYISQLLIDCEIDIALVEGSVNEPRIISQKWQDDPLSIVAPNEALIAKQKKVSDRDLNEQIWVMREVGSGTREITDELLHASRVIPKKMIEIGSNEGIARAVAGGSGVAILPTIVVKDLIDLQRIYVLSLSDSHQYTRPLSLLHIRERPLSPLAKQFIAFLNEERKVEN